MEESHEAEAIIPPQASPAPTEAPSHHNRIDTIKEALAKLMHPHGGEAPEAPTTPPSPLPDIAAVSPANTLETFHGLPRPKPSGNEDEKPPWEREPKDLIDALGLRQEQMTKEIAPNREKMPFLRRIGVRLGETWSRVSQLPNLFKKTLLNAMVMTGGH